MRQRTAAEWEALGAYIGARHDRALDRWMNTADENYVVRMDSPEWERFMTWRNLGFECERRMTTTTIEGDAS